MASTLTDSLGPGLVLVIAVMWLAIIVATVTLPFVILSIASSLRGIRRELERLNGGAVGADVRTRAAADAIRDHARPSDLGHQLLR